ncbi:hypothetical protein QJS10_CPB21g00241 [Acorus calamus]|uniref:Uncharacterized protein n=1 Tax=Acorus calamus TaxID=4465 RepID=A0AAV9C6S8_ACOCL|nr:hypothetical protein QJS10_CPB21g00241 [Acorus calamus]
MAAMAARAVFASPAPPPALLRTSFAGRPLTFHCRSMKLSSSASAKPLTIVAETKKAVAVPQGQLQSRGRRHSPPRRRRSLHL